MSKKKNGVKRASKPLAKEQSIMNAVAAPDVEKLLPMWNASFENASKIYQSSKMDLDIEVDSDWLKTVLKSFKSSDDYQKLEKWIGRFGTVCKELSKYQGNLEAECSDRWDRLTEQGLALEKERAAIEEQREALEGEQELISSQKVELNSGLVQLTKDRELIVKSQRELHLREANAEAGFINQNEKALQELEKASADIKKQLKQDLDELRKNKSDLLIELSSVELSISKAKYDLSDSEVARSVALDQREEELAKSKVSLDSARRRLDREWSDIGNIKDNLASEVDSVLAGERENFAMEIEKLTNQREKAWKKATDLQEQLLDLHEFTQELGDRKPSDLLSELQKQRSQISDLKAKLAGSDAEELQRSNDYLKNRVTDLESDLSTLQPELDSARRELSTKRVAATELEGVAREKRVLETHKNTLTLHIDDLESRIDQLTNAQKSQTAFPVMSEMDSSKKLNASIELESVPDLKVFASELQHRIAQAEKNVPLYYPIEEIRILLAGLSMSQLHVFQGISGTGKTSLAKAFAKAVGGFCTDIAVQAGWRDRDDLLGHFNAFERRFYEKDCLQALYKAQTNRWQDCCNIILLDEMNLSRPEQYFAEFLSAIEKNDINDRIISLSESSLPGAPIKLRDGRYISVPENVWFIGTANQDETTNELADKTYDRAHVMTLPKQDHQFSIKQMKPVNYSFKSLNKAFDEAANKHSARVKDLLTGMSASDFSTQLETEFGLGWGNRFEKQALRFLPVMCASGSNSGSALDHMLAHRVMRQGKVTARYDVNTDGVRNLIGALNDLWKDLELEGIPERSLELLEKDIKRKEAGF